MSASTAVKVAVVGFGVALAIGSGFFYRSKPKATKPTTTPESDFDREIEDNLRHIGGEELVLQYKAEVLRRTGKI